MQVFGKLASCSLVIKKLYMENILEWFQLKSNKKLILCIHSGSQNCACTKHTYMAYSIESTLQYDRSTL